MGDIDQAPDTSSVLAGASLPAYPSSPSPDTSLPQQPMSGGDTGYAPTLGPNTPSVLANMSSQPTPQPTMNADGSMTLPTNPTYTPPTPPQPGTLFRLVQGALSGLASVQPHGRPSFLNGVAAGARGGMEAHQQQVENQQRQQQINTQQQEAQSNIKFQSLRAAQSVAEEARKVQEFHDLSKERQLEIAQKTAEHNVYLQDQGLEPDVVAPDTSDSAHGMMKTFSDMNGGTVPELSVNHDPVKGEVSVFAPTPGDDATKKASQLAFINKGRAILGMPAITMDAIRKPADRAAAFHDAFEVTNPIATDVNPNNVVTMLNNTQQQRNRWAKMHPDDESTLKQLDNRISFLKTSQDSFTKSKTDAEAAGEQAKLNVENSPANQQAAARGAALKSSAEKTADLNAQDAHDKKMNQGDPTLTGEDYINSLPPERAATVRAIGEGRQILTSGMLRSKTGIEISGQVNRAYPGFDVTRSESYGKAREKFTSGKIADGINNLNTAAIHLGLLYDSSTTSAVSPGASFISRHVVQPFSKTNTNATNFQQYKEKVLSEIEHAYNNKALTDSDHAAMKDIITGWTPNTARAQERALGTLLESKLSAYKSEWETAKPSAAVPDLPIISNEASAALSRVTGKPVGTISPAQSRQTLPVLSPAAQAFVNKWKPQPQQGQ